CTRDPAVSEYLDWNLGSRFDVW
nr:immunoglobulin heavy chain junction region [Macaca mulatta]MOV44419.1 immunoglobulin heavy chain junction region [Macaca mulatta]